MKLYKREDFIKLPADTIYSRLYKQTSDLFEGLYCKMSGKDMDYDFVEQNLLNEAGFPNNINDGTEAILYVENLRDTFKDFETDLDCSGRDGCYDDNDLFVVWDKKDIKKLYDFLGNCL